MTCFPDNPYHRRHLLWNLAHYASGPENTHVIVKDIPNWKEQPLTKFTLKESLSQGDGVATPTFDLVYTLLVIRPLKKIFAKDKLDILLCHDDTTVISPLFRAPANDPEGNKLKEIPLEQLRDLIDKFKDT